MEAVALFWDCRQCGKRENASNFSCSECGYHRTEYDKSRMKAGDTGKFTALKVRQPSFSEISKTSSSLGSRTVWAFAAGTGVILALAVAAILLKY